MPSQDAYILEHVASFRQLKHMELLSLYQLSSYWFLGHWKSPYLSPLTIGAGEGLHLCILNFFKIFFMYAFCDSPYTLFLLSRWVSIPRTNEASPRSFISNFFVSSSRLTSLLASKISSTYRIRKINFPFLNFVLTQLSSIFSLKPKILYCLIKLQVPLSWSLF